jgi:hypothetical protein
MEIMPMIIRSNTRMPKPMKTKGNLDVIVDASRSKSMEGWTSGWRERSSVGIMTEFRQNGQMIVISGPPS